MNYVLRLELSERVKALTEKFRGFTTFLAKTFIQKNGTEISLSQLPWYLFIGPTGTGKTTLLANANVHFILAKKFNQSILKAISPSSSCDWWVTREMVLVDVPGTYMNSKPKKAAYSNPEALSDSMLWNTFINLVKKFRGKRALNGVMIALSLSDLMGQSKTGANTINDLKQRIADLRAHFGNHLPFFITITKCDGLPGFTEFFSDSGSDELSQAWGVTLPALKENEKLADIFSIRFNALIKRLNKQLITRLHQERNPLARTYIKDFPLHIENLKENIIKLLKAIAPAEKTFQLQSIYLTSAVQHGAEELAANSIHTVPSASKALSIAHHTIIPSRPYFVRQVLLQGLASAPHSYTKPEWKWQQRPAVYIVSAVITLAAAFVIAKDFRHNLKQTNAIRAGLVQYQSQQTFDINSALPLLNALEDKVHTTSHIFHSAKSKANALAAYQQALLTIIVTPIKNTFENYLLTSTSKNSEDFYLVLKAYIELGDAQHTQPDFIIKTLKRIAPAALNNKNADQILHYLHAAFNVGLPPVALDPEALAQTRKRLASLSPAALSYIILKNSDDNDAGVPLSLTKDTSNKQPIPKMFTGEFFQNIYTKKTEIAALEAEQGNWILGTNPTLSNQQSYAQLVDQLRSLYVSNYINVWENLLANTKLAAPKNLAETDNIVANLISRDSLLLQVIHVIKQNTLFAPIIAASPKLAAINSEQDHTVNNIITDLRLLHADLQKILTSHNVANAAFQNAAERMEELPRQEINDPITQLHKVAETSPEPMKNWLHSIANYSWRYTLQEAASYAENHWQSEVMSAYRSEFLNRFPLWIEATQETPVNQFEKFLNPHGTLSNYYQSFLLPFVENKNKKLQWKQIDNQKIPFSDQALENLEFALTMQSVFFPDNNNQLAVRFTLQPFFLEKNTQSITLNINGQKILHDRTMPNIPQTLVWASTQTEHETKINLMNRSNKSINSAVGGEWGLFRLVNQATTKILNSHELMLSFEINGHNAKYYLFTKGNANPFLSLPHLRLPEQLGEAKENHIA